MDISGGMNTPEILDEFDSRVSGDVPSRNSTLDKASEVRMDGNTPYYIYTRPPVDWVSFGFG